MTSAISRRQHGRHADPRNHRGPDRGELLVLVTLVAPALVAAVAAPVGFWQW
jgi:hypothetical protein